MSDKLDARQAAVNQIRHWVRLTRACNNRCAFCLDSASHDVQPIPVDIIKQKLIEGRDKGATRLILSGGEPTIHPQYIDFIRMGRELGYDWVQTISNGRMFSYEKFTVEAIEAGLREATLSMHAHTPELYAQLTGVKAFPQALKGLINLLRNGAVVSVDIVLTRLNLPVLKEILQFYMNLGVFEFDLLHLVPFGRAFDENRRHLYADDDTIRDGLHRALTLAGDPRLYLWTNRLQIQYLEGHEDLFQDPQKLYDEVLGERQIFKRLFSTGEMVDCLAEVEQSNPSNELSLGPRCPHCFIKPFCVAARRYAMGQETAPRPKDELELDFQTAKELLALGKPELEAKTKNGLRVATRVDFREAIAAAPDLEDLKKLGPKLQTPIKGLPPCLFGPTTPEMLPQLGEAQLVDGKIQLAPFVDFFIKELYLVKSLRCRKCAMNDTCAGLHVNLARHWGLKVLTPIRQAEGA